MTTNSIMPIVSYVEDGATLTHPIPFRFLSLTDLIVERHVGTATAVPVVGWSALGAGNPGGGTLIKSSPGIPGSVLQIRRRTPRLQSVDYQASDTFPAESHEGALDKSMLIDQEQDASITDLQARSLQVPFGEVALPVEPLADRLGKVALWSSAGRLASISYSALATAIASYLPYELRGDRGPRGYDTLDLAWTETFEGAIGQTEFTTTNAFVAGVVDVLLNGVELLRTEFTTPQQYKVVLATPLPNASFVVIKAFHIPSGADVSSVVRVDDFGAVGDGITDDTAAINAAFVDAPKNTRIQLTPGKVYRVDPIAGPVFQNYGGIKIDKDGQVLDLNGGELRALIDSSGVSSVVTAYKKNNWQILGPGRITGDRNIHTASGGEFGHGVTTFAGKGWLIGPGVEVTACWGDGICLLPSLVGGVPQGDFNEDYRVEGVHVWDCRRNGVAPIAARRGKVINSLIHDINGTPPAFGIDFEPDSAAHFNDDNQAYGNTIYNCACAIGLTVGNRNTRIHDNNLTGSNAGVLIADNTIDAWIYGNTMKSLGASEGAAFRALGANVLRVTVTDNDIIDGQFFAVETLGGQDIAIRFNRIYARRAGMSGFARMLSGRAFVENDCRMDAGVGIAGNQFLQLGVAEYGRNTYRYAGGIAVGNAIVSGGVDLGGDYFEAPLKRASGKSGVGSQVLWGLRKIDAAGGALGADAILNFDIVGPDCVNNPLVAQADGGGENTAADAYKVKVRITNETTSGARISVQNQGVSPQSINIRANVVTGS